MTGRIRQPMQPALSIPMLKTITSVSADSYIPRCGHTDLNRLSSPQLFPLCSQFLSKGFLPPSPQVLHRRDMRRENGVSQPLLRPGNVDRHVS